MNNREQHKPIFGFLWPSNTRIPLEQSKFLRVGTRGAIRLAALIISTMTLTFFAVSSLAYLATARPSLPETLFISLLVATASVSVFRAWTLGTYVNDRGIKIVTALRTKTFSWSAIRNIDTDTYRWLALGVPLPMKSTRVLVQLPTGERIPTHIYLGSVDGIFTRDQLEADHLLLLRWFRAE